MDDAPPERSLSLELACAASDVLRDFTLNSYVYESFVSPFTVTVAHATSVRHTTLAPSVPFACTYKLCDVSKIAYSSPSVSEACLLIVTSTVPTVGFPTVGMPGV